MGILYGILSMFGWGTADFLGAKSSRRVGHFLTLFWMQFIGTLIAFIYFLIKFSTLNIGEIYRYSFPLLIIAILQTGAYLNFYKGLEKGKVSIVSPLASSWALVTVILSVIFYKESLTNLQIVSIISIISGIILLSVDLKEISKIRKLKIFTGVKEGIIAMLGWGISFFLMSPVSKNLGWFLPVFIFKVFAVVILLFFFLLKVDKELFLRSLQFPTLFFLLPIGFLDVGSFFSYSVGIRIGYSSIIAPIAASFPLVTIFLARIFFKERITTTQVIGIAAVLGGIILISI